MNRRIERLQAALAQSKVNYALIFEAKDFYYFSGTMQNGVLVVPRDGTPTLLIRRVYERAVQESWIEDIRKVSGLRELKGIIKDGGKLGVEEDVLSVEMYRRLQGLFPKSEFVDISFPIRMIRAVKDQQELECIFRSGAINDAAHQKVKEMLTEGLTELEVSAELERELRRRGYDRTGKARDWNSLLLSPQVASGAAASYPNRFFVPLAGVGLSPACPQGPSWKRIVRGEPIVIDTGGIYNGYMTDQTRTYCLGDPPPEALQAYQVCLEIHDRLKESMRPGIPVRKLYQLALGIAGEYDYKENFMGIGEYRVNFVGHGVGLELNDFPIIGPVDMTLEENMVVAIEPKIISPGKWGVGIENTFVITPNGVEPVTKTETDLIIL